MENASYQYLSACNGRAKRTPINTRGVQKVLQIDIQKIHKAL